MVSIDKETALKNDLFNFRVLLVIAIILHPLMGYIRNHSEPNIIDPMSFRIAISAYGLIVLLLSYSNNKIQKHILSLGYVFAYLISIDMFYVLVVNHFIASYTLGTFLVLFATSIVFNNAKALVLYLIFMISAAFLSCYLVVNPETNPTVFVSTFCCMGIITFTALKTKIKIREELENINILLKTEVDEKQRAELEVKQLNKHLKENIHELKIVNSDLEAFTYSVSHDLRVPLRNINSISGILRKNSTFKSNTEASEMVDALYTNTIAMDKLISDLLAFSLLGKHEIKKLTIDMTELTKDILAEFCKSDNKMIETVKIAPLLVAKGDYTLIHQVLINLISNAFKYSSKTIVRKIEIGSKQGKNENIYFIKDNGVGFDNQYSNKLFEVFQRLHNRDDFEGFGVGLAIVKRIIDKHGGRVWAESVEGEGATFYFSIPEY